MAWRHLEGIFLSDIDGKRESTVTKNSDTTGENISEL